MTQHNDSSKPLRASRRSKRVGASDPQEVQKFLVMIDKVLRTRFRDYSSKDEALEPLNSISDLKTLDDVFSKACYAKTFEEFCLSVARIWGKYEELTKSREEPQLLLANVFNNHVATVLGVPGDITTQFLKMSVRRISPELARQLDFKRAKSEPTVFVFGNNVSRICDLLFTIPYKDRSRGVFPIVVLMEHKSTPDRNVVEQMLTSLVATIEFEKRYPERFKTSEGKIIWPFVVLFYTGAQQWNNVQNLSDLFTTSLKKLDQDWIFNLRFLLISLVDKRIDVVPSITAKEEESPPETFDKAIQNADWLAFFFDLLRKSELLANNPNATREEWLNDVGESLHILKKVYDKSKEYDGVVLDKALSLVSTMCAKKHFELPKRDELVNLMEKEEVEGMIRRTWLLSDEEWEAAERKGRSDGERDGEIKGRSEGKREGQQDILAQMIGLRFPKATPAFIKKALKPFSDSYALELMAAVLATDSLDEFKKKVKALAPTGC